jgi:hypothetical protein
MICTFVSGGMDVVCMLICTLVSGGMDVVCMLICTLVSCGMDGCMYANMYIGIWWYGELYAC